MALQFQKCDSRGDNLAPIYKQKEILLFVPNSILKTVKFYVSRKVGGRMSNFKIARRQKVMSIMIFI